MLRTSHCSSLLVLMMSCTSVSDGGAVRSVATQSADERVAAALELRSVQSSRKDGRLVVRFDLVNRTPDELAFRWTVDWFDRAGAKIEYGPQSWSSDELEGGQVRMLELQAPTPEAASWQLRSAAVGGAQGS